ncbi:MAG: RNA polymerase sigma factor [Acidimicrobiales bacterium]
MERPVETAAPVDGARLHDDVTVRWAAGDPEALRGAYDAWGAAIHTYCARRLSADDAADATQEVFVSAWRARQQFDPTRGSLPQWLFGIARNACYGIHRKRASRIVSGGDDGLDGMPATVEPDVLPDRLLLAEALQRLPERQRAVLLASFVDDQTNHEVAERLSLPLGTVKSDIRRGLRTLRSHLGGSR